MTQTEPCVNVIAPGLIFIKHALSKELQLWLSKYAVDAGNRPDNGFWVETSDPEGKAIKVLNSDIGRGRIYDDISKFPDSGEVEGLCQNLVSTARKHDSHLPKMNPTHLLLLYYATHEGMEWHVDNDINDGKNDHPIVSITIGNACDFGYKLIGKEAQTLRLESGDVLIWGGVNRMLLHCVEKVYQNTCPDFLQSIFENARLNFTYRDAPDARGREHQFKYNFSGFNVEK
ncbi:alpha-ketoglutarate-dependent dioxygenase [Acrasis kona]|uniref:Alpha-ketoglutarate-dependent dioxygenase n=1 Tax=Acrasis kona TaxID=1008807 RepID=A0AAW2ZEE2_9EUKA